MILDIVEEKVITGIALLGVAILVVYWKGDLPPNFSSFLNILYASFVVGHGFDRYTDMKSNSGDNKQ